VWITEWQAISARIAGLVGAGTFFLQTKENDDFNVSDDLIQNATRVSKTLQQWSQEVRLDERFSLASKIE
jgi:hypothetical protein